MNAKGFGVLNGEWKLSALAGLLATFFLAGGCSTVSVVKVDANGKKVADAVEGIPFYLPRPYIDVFEPFVVDTRIAWADGELTPDGKYVRLTQVPLLDTQGLKGFTGAYVSNDNTIYLPTASMGLTEETPPPKKDSPTGLQGSVEATSSPLDSIIQSLGNFASSVNKTGSNQTAGSGQGGTNNQSGGTNQTPSKSGSGGGGTNSTSKAGTGSLQVTNNPTAWMITPTRRFFDILWLPDFDEKYVVHPNYRMGSLNTSISLGQSWSLQGLNSTVDNSAVVQPLLDFYGSSLQTLSAALQTAAGMPPVGNLAKTAASAVSSLQGSNEVISATNTSATQPQKAVPITLKVTIARMVAPGLYPILKPKEQEKIAGDAKQFDDDGNYYEPKPPFTIVAFKTYPVLVAEAVIPAGDSPLNFTRYKDIDTTNSSAGGGGGGGSAGKQQNQTSGPSDTGTTVDPALFKPIANTASNTLAKDSSFLDANHKSVIVRFSVSQIDTGTTAKVESTLALTSQQINGSITNAVTNAVNQAFKSGNWTNWSVGTVDIEAK